jgi:hypothetical protein
MIWVLTLTDIFTNVLLVVGRPLAAATSTRCLALVRSSVDTIGYRSKTDSVL